MSTTIFRTIAKCSIAALIIVAGVTISVATASAQSAPGLTKLRFANWAPKIVDEADIICAIELGFMKDEGIEIEWITSNGTGDALLRVISGAADFAGTSPDAILFAKDKGANVKAFYSIQPQNQFEIVARKSRGINSPGDLRGKKIAVVSTASASRYNVIAVLKGNGMEESDADIIATGLNFEGVLEAGRVDAAGGWRLKTWDLKNGKLPKEIADDLVVFPASNYVNQPTAVYAATDEVLKSKSDALRRMLRAVRKGQIFVHENPAKAAEIAASVAVSKGSPERNLAVVNLRIDIQKDEASRKSGLGSFTDKLLDEFAAKYHEWGLVKGRYRASDFATNDLVNALGK